MTPEQVKKAMEVDCPWCDSLAGEICRTIEMVDGKKVRMYPVSGTVHATRLRYAESPE